MPWSKYLINPIEAHKIFVDNGSSMELGTSFRTRCLAEFPPDVDGALFLKTGLIYHSRTTIMKLCGSVAI